jgi:hypothetical protein
MIAIQQEIIGGEVIAGRFVQVEREIENLSTIFEELGIEALADIRHRIDNHPGPPLAASTIKKKGHARILRDKDELYGSFQKAAPGNVFRISATEGEFGTFDKKAVFHQEGTGRMPKRTIIEVTGEQEAKYTKIAMDKLSERIKAIGFEIT